MGTWITQWATTIWIIPAAVSSTAAAVVARGKKLNPFIPEKLLNLWKSIVRLAPLLIEQMIFVRIPSQHTLQHLKIKVNASLCLRLYFVGTPKYTCESTSKKRADTLPVRAALALSPFPRTLISIGQKNCDATKQNQPQDYRRISRSRQQSTSVTLKTGSHIWHVCSVSGTRF